MIHATFFRRSRDLIGYEINGHAEYAPEGQPDIVCSAVSALAQTTVIGLNEIAHIPADWKIEKSGRLYCRVSDGIDRQQTDQTLLLMETLKAGLASIAEAYPGYLKISIKEV